MLIFFLLGFLVCSMTRSGGFREICALTITSGNVTAFISWPVSLWDIWPARFLYQIPLCSSWCRSMPWGLFFLSDITTVTEVLASCRLWGKAKILYFWFCQHINQKDLLCDKKLACKLIIIFKFVLSVESSKQFFPLAYSAFLSVPLI